MVMGIYFDAHGDVTTPTTTISGYLGGMPITGAMGGGIVGLDLE